MLKAFFAAHPNARSLTGMSLPRRYRLSGQAAFSNVFEQAVVSADASFKVLGRGSTRQNSRLGMAVSRQVDKSAVARNRLKRVIRESFRMHFEQHIQPDAAAEPLHQAVDVVVLPRRHAVSLGNAELFEQLARHWQRIERRINPAFPGSSQQPNQTI